jgi:hypothetical protein
MLPQKTTPFFGGFNFLVLCGSNDCENLLSVDVLA